MKILICQNSIPLSLNTKDHHDYVEQLISQIRANIDNDVSLIVLPELSTTHYSVESFSNLENISEELFGFTFGMFSSLARELSSYIVFGIARREKELIYISQVVVDEKGEYVSHYDKLHLAQFGNSLEKNYFSRGDSVCVFSLNNIKIGIIICYDIRFPELTSRLRYDLDIDVLLHPSAFSEDETFYSWHKFAITRAIENGIYLISVNRAGKEWGNSIICPPWLNKETFPTTLGKEEEFYTYNVDINELNNIREEFSFHKDKLPDYRDLFTEKANKRN